MMNKVRDVKKKTDTILLPRRKGAVKQQDTVLLIGQINALVLIEVTYFSTN